MINSISVNMQNTKSLSKKGHHFLLRDNVRMIWNFTNFVRACLKKRFLNYILTCTVGTKKEIPLHYILTYKKLVPIFMDYFLLQFDALKFFSGVHLLGGSLLNFNFFNINPQIFKRSHKVLFWNCLDTNFHNIQTLVRELLDVGIIANASF